MREDILEADSCTAVGLLECCLRSIEIIRGKLGTRATGEVRSTIGEGTALEDIGAHYLRETTGRDTEGALEVLDDRSWERQSRSVGNEVLGRQLHADHELSKVAHSLGTGRNLGNVTHNQIRLDVSLLDFGKASSKTELLGLEQKVGVLATGDLMLVDAATNGGG